MSDKTICAIKQADVNKGNSRSRAIRLLTSAIVLLWSLVVAAQESGSVVELVTGETVVGEIQGTIVLGGHVSSGKKGALSSGLYFLIQGEDIISITSKGVLVKSEAVVNQAIFGSKSKKQPVPEPLEALSLLIRLSENVAATYKEAMEKGLLQFSSKPLKEELNPLQVRLMGELQSAEDKLAILPELTVLSSSGLKTVSVEQIVDYIGITERKKKD